MCGIDDVVVLIGDDNAGHSEDGGSPLICPHVTDALGRSGRRTPSPILRKVVRGDRKYECVVEGRRDQDITREYSNGAQPCEDLQKAKCPGSRCVHQRDTGAVPSTTECSRSLTVESRTGVAILHDPPHCRHATEGCRVPAVRPDSPLREPRFLYWLVQGESDHRARYAEL